MGTEVETRERAALLFSFLTTEPNAVVAPIQPKAMPVVIELEDAKTWLTATPTDALKLHKAVPDDALVLLDRD